MSVQMQIDRIYGAVSAALAALTEKGVIVPDGTKVDGLAALIAAIEAGATLTVTAPALCTVTVSKDGKSKTKVADLDGVAVFKGLSSGDWLLSITDGEQEAQKTVAVTADYSTEITFFSAIIHVTYPAGSTCTTTDGVTTLTAPDTSGTWDCVVPNAGTWTVSCTNGQYTANSTVSITSNGQNSTVELSYDQYLFKDGNQYTDITGGWVSQGYYVQAASTTQVGCGDLSVTNNMLTLTPVSGKRTLAGTLNKIDLSGYKTLRFVVYKAARDSYFGVRSDGRYALPNPSMRKTFTTPGTYDLDISSANTSYYITFLSCNVSEVLLKR